MTTLNSVRTMTDARNNPPTTKRELHQYTFVLQQIMNTITADVCIFVSMTKAQAQEQQAMRRRVSDVV